MSKAYVLVCALILGAGAVNAVTPGYSQAQTASDLNRASQAMALCNSPAGQFITECQQLKGVMMLGGIPGVPGVAGIAQGNPMAAAAAQSVYAACITRAGVNQSAIAQCNASLNNAMGLPQPMAAPRGLYDSSTNTAMNIASYSRNYQQCVASLGGQAGGINPCTPLLNGSPAGAGAPAGFGAPAAYNPPAPAYAPPQQPSAPFDPLG